MKPKNDMYDLVDMCRLTTYVCIHTHTLDYATDQSIANI